MSSTISVISGTNDKPVASSELIETFKKQQRLEGQLMIGYPIIGTPQGRHAIDAIFVSPQIGIVVFDLIEGLDVGDYSVRQDDAANKLEARLKTHRELMLRRKILIPVHTLSFAPGVVDVDKYLIDDYPLATPETLGENLSEFEWPNSEQRVYEIALSAIQSISTIRTNRNKRTVARENSRGAKLKSLEDSIATLDNRQGKAVLETVDGVQRIRGLAGSGKTIVLALKAAYLHAQHPEWRIAVTFNTRSLKGQFRRLIYSFSVEQGEEPDWEKLRVLSAWGAPGGEERDGIYYEFCRTHGIEYYDYNQARRKFSSNDAFAGACQQALATEHEKIKLYDAILVDEAQDFPPEFLRLCYEALGDGDTKRLVYAYDELQSLSDQSLPSPEELFGSHDDGTPKVRFDITSQAGARQDIILNKCYRNSGPVLVTAHALGFGIYRKQPEGETTGLVQMFDNPHLWEDIGYKKSNGELSEGSEVTLYRPEESSPKFLEEHSPVSDLIQFICVENASEQRDLVAKEIKKNLEEDELRHDDIVVINPNPLSTRKEVGPIRRRLMELGIQTHTAGVDTDPDVFFKNDFDSVTFTGIYRAKGNEAGMVYIINAQDCHSSAWNLATIRNRLFTAITRSKAWVRVIGYGPGMQELVEEFEQVKRHNFELKFVYPTEEERKKLQIVHRDVTAAEQQQLTTSERAITHLYRSLMEGRIHPEDLNPEIKEKLRSILNDRRE